MNDDFSEIRERLARLEYAEERSQQDRSDMKTDIKAVREDVATIKGLVEQVRGGAKVAWVAYGLIGGVAAAITWLISKLPFTVGGR